MKLLASAAPLGVLPHYYAPVACAHGPTFQDVFAAAPSLPRTLDPEGVRLYLARQPDGHRTCFEHVRLLPADHDLLAASEVVAVRQRAAMAAAEGPLLLQLETALRKILGSCRRPVLALSGGLDSALILALLRRIGARVPVCTLVTGWDGYCEADSTHAAARSLGGDEVLVIEASREQFITSLPEAILACGTPLFNLHPVSKWLLARALAGRGFDCVITGDGADQVFSGSDARNYLPIIGAMVRAAGLTLASPFLAEEVIAWSKSQGVDHNKTVLRQAAAEVLPLELVHRPKSPRLAPEFDLALYRSDQWDAHVAELLGGAPIPDHAPGPANTLWATLALLIQQTGAGR